jgi:hypothetical protein
VALSPDTRDFVFHTAAKFGHEAPFQADAVRALAKGGYVDIDLLLDPGTFRGYHLSPRLQEAFREVAKRLSREHFSQLISKIDTLPYNLSDAIKVSADRVASEDLDVLIARLDFTATQALKAAAEQLTPVQLHVLVTKLYGPEEEVRRNAAEVLGATAGRLETEDLISVLSAKVDLSYASGEALGRALKANAERMSHEQLRQLIANITTLPGAVVRALAARQTELINDDLDRLIAQLDDPVPEMRAAAAAAVRAAHPPLRTENLDRLVARLADSYSEVVSAVISTLWAARKLLGTQHLYRLTALLGYPEEKVRRAAAEVVWAANAQVASEFLDLLIARLDYRAAEILEKVGERLTSQQLHALLMKLDDPESDIRRRAAAVLRAAAEWLAGDHLDSLIERLNHPDASLQSAIIEILGAAHAKLTPEQLNQLIARRGAPDPKVRRAMVEALDAAQRCDELASLLDDPDLGVQCAAASALARNGYRLEPDGATKLLGWVVSHGHQPYFSIAMCNQIIKVLCDTGNLRADQLGALVALATAPGQNWDSRYNGTTVGLFALGKQLKAEHIRAVISMLDRFGADAVNPCLLLHTVVADRVYSSDLSRLIDKIDFSSGYVRDAAAIVLKAAGKRLSREQLEACLDKLQDGNSYEVGTIFEILGTAGRVPGNEWLVPIIEAYLNHERGEARSAAYGALVRIYRSGVSLTPAIVAEH